MHHVLFLEYNNQRAWLQSSALSQYRGRQKFEQEAAAAGSSRKKDFSPGKRYQSQFDRAVEFSESLQSLSDEERLEAVLTKYGWVMVTETEHSHVHSPKPKKRKVNSECELEANKSTDSETDSQQGADKVKMHRLGSSDRRSSTEAESRLDPAVDTQDGDHDATSSLPTKKKKRESSIVAAIAMNGDSSSDDNQSDVDQSFSKKSKYSDQSAPKLKPDSSSVPSTPTTPRPGTDDEFPRLGDLVWGRMSGFPYWPSFITKSPQGQYKKVGANGKANYHVQFFNWNDESGWVNAVMEFDGLDAFKTIAAKKKSDKSYNPAKAMYKKWERAAKDAEETMDLTRSERLNCFLVTYGSGGAKKVAPKPSPSVKSSTKQSTPRTKKQAPVASPSVAVVSQASGNNQMPRRVPGPASRTGLKASPSRATGGQLPAGWRIRDRQEGGQTYISPDGREFQDKFAAMRYVSSNVSQNQSNSSIVYLKDTTLPAGWKCQKIHSSIYYFSPKGERFESRDDVASRLELDGASPEVISRIRRGGKKKKIGPKSVLRQSGYEVMSDTEIYSSTSEDEDPEHIMRLPNKLKYRKGGRTDPYLDVDRLFDESSGGMIEMVQLPDIFLGHPTVRVTEADNEMVISDIETGEFIAKKIIYD